MKAAVIQAAQAVNTGNIPAGLRRLISDLTEPMLDWRTMLEMNIQSAIREDFSWMRPNKRSWACKAILPGQNYGTAIEVMVFIDTSGSISDSMIRDFLSEVKGIMETFPDFIIHLASIDAAIYNYVKYTPENMNEIDEYKAKGGGGNDFPLMFRWMKENDILPQSFVCFTDGWPCGSWGDPKYCDNVLWIVHGDGGEQPTFGTRVPYVKEESGRSR
jgi:predicted metal-dependent peptidase